MNDTWGAWFYRRPTNPPNHKKALREWLGCSDSIEIVNLKIPWGLWFYRCIFRKRVSVSRIITIKLSTPTLSLNSKGDGISILQSRSLEDLFCHFTVGQGWPQIKQDVKFGIFYLIFQMLVYPFYSGEPFCIYGLRLDLTILQQLWVNHSTGKNCFFVKR